MILIMDFESDNNLKKIIDVFYKVMIIDLNN